MTELKVLPADWIEINKEAWLEYGRKLARAIVQNLIPSDPLKVGTESYHLMMDGCLEIRLQVRLTDEWTTLVVGNINPQDWHSKLSS